ncbi:LOW QUALITY PROTEIN: hypothetical protein HID58_088244 [Brassica napus]|uniref:Alkyl transferase n=1 Tax=Brassica napus TaxID=3708 RepID=A0ABQ7XVM6_BRANA|nr:LOW QUALITY PROTEIN: hypothetical protein HID58_088244 [Brassica napus]
MILVMAAGMKVQRTVTHWFNQIGDGAVYRSGGINSSGVTTAELMPKHVAVEMDGNGRWTKNQGFQPWDGHRVGVEALRALRWGVQVFTVFAFSNDNLKYDLFEYALDFLGYIFCSVEPIWYLISLLIEIDFLLSLFETLKSELCRNNVRISIIGDSSKLPKSLLKVINEVEEVTKSKTRLQLIVARDVCRNNVRISIIGDSSKLPKSLLEVINEVEEVTKNNTRLQLIVAVGYSGKYDVVQACRGIAQRVKDGEIDVEEIDEGLIEQELETNVTEFPYPDLLIRTSGELRVSNFFWLTLFFAQELWPDFGRNGFVEALMSFQQRQRRFGGRKS